MGAAFRPARLGSNALALRTVAPLRTNRTTAPDLLIVTHASLRAAADRLADDFEAVVINAKGQIVTSCRPTDLSQQSPLLGALTPLRF